MFTCTIIREKLRDQKRRKVWEREIGEEEDERDEGREREKKNKKQFL
jgi:hypothetical protein